MNKLNSISRFLVIAGLLTLLAGCVTTETPEPVESLPEPVEVKQEPEVSPLEQLAEILNERGFSTSTNARGLVVYLPSLFFDVDSADLDLETQARIRSISEVMNSGDFTEFGIAVEGHTDSLGDDAVNMALSQQRAEAVADHLVFSNISTDRIEIAWFGETAPLAPEIDPDGRYNNDNRAKNRRVEFIITSPES